MANILERVESLRSGRPYQNYLRARQAVLAMIALPLERIPMVARPSAYWEEELSRFLYMFDASPLIIEQLRHHSYHITGIHAFGYRSGGRRKELPRYQEKLDTLRTLDEHGLFVPEARELGGFGYEIEGKLVNIDTLKFYECMIAMSRGGALDQPHRHDQRRVVLEIGSGWGGLAYTFKSLFPNTCYILLDLPELFLFSATYLLTLFPDAKVGFFTGGRGDVDGAWADYDFIFVPNTLQQELRPERLDLTINTVSFQEMTAEQVRGYVALVAGLGCPTLYSLNRGRSLYVADLGNVHEIMSECYNLKHVPMLSVPYTKMLEPGQDVREVAKEERLLAMAKQGQDSELPKAEEMKLKARMDKDDTKYHHMVGWRKNV